MKFMEISASSEFRPSLFNEVASSLISTPLPFPKARQHQGSINHHNLLFLSTIKSPNQKNRYTPRRLTAGTWKWWSLEYDDFPFSRASRLRKAQPFIFLWVLPHPWGVPRIHRPRHWRCRFRKPQPRSVTPNGGGLVRESEPRSIQVFPVAH